MRSGRLGEIIGASSRHAEQRNKTGAPGPSQWIRLSEGLPLTDKKQRIRQRESDVIVSNREDTTLPRCTCPQVNSPKRIFFFFFFLALHSSLAGNSGRLTWIRLQQPQEQRYPFLTVRAVFIVPLRFPRYFPIQGNDQTKVWLPVLGIFNVRSGVNAYDCTRGL